MYDKRHPLVSKIGRTHDLKQRLEDVNYSPFNWRSWNKYVCACKVNREDAPRIEKELHKKYHKYVIERKNRKGKITDTEHFTIEPECLKHELMHTFKH